MTTSLLGRGTRLRVPAQWPAVIHPQVLNEMTLQTPFLLCDLDTNREGLLPVAEHRDPNGQPHIVGIARLSRSHHADEAEFSVLVSDEWQQQGLGSELLRRIVKIGRDARLKKITGTILEDNCAMQRLAIKCGFALRHVEGECVAEMIL